MHDLSDHYRKAGYWSDRLLTDFLQQAVRQSPQKLAIKDDRFGTPLNHVASTDGQPFPATELKVLGLNGEQLPPGQEGGLVMRGPQQCLGYFENPRLDRKTFLKDKWFCTGDLAVLISPWLYSRVLS